MEGLQVLTLEDVVSEADIFCTTTGNKDIIMVDHMRKMKNNAIVCNIGHFDNEIDMQGLETFPGVKRITIKPQTDRWVFPDTKSGIIVLAEGRLMNLGCATGHPSFVMSCSFTNQHLDEKVAALHLGKLGARLTKLTNDQSDYVSIPIEGPYKLGHYRPFELVWVWSGWGNMRYWSSDEADQIFRETDVCFIAGFLPVILSPSLGLSIRLWYPSTGFVSGVAPSSPVVVRLLTPASHLLLRCRRLSPGSSRFRSDQRFCGPPINVSATWILDESLMKAVLFERFSFVVASPLTELRRASSLAPEEVYRRRLDAWSIGCWATGHVVDAARFPSSTVSFFGFRA
ncbi:hypothetical protein F2Q69_00019404 [Brassica cretica]|uniref:adenosylhomocysteinase n=1 Tax=Brassica cretica TaxID=69181 RepID=A0A8S9QP72_BRACR|nr:hypothetical protein F2Q69_00019404 [Brassica cretica]